MPLYHELNDIRLNLADYEAETLTEMEQHRWKKRVLQKLRSSKPKRSHKIIAIAAALIVTAGVTFTFSPSTLASVPFIGGIIEQFLNQNQPSDYSPYKTAIGETAENRYGKLTLNEVLVDSDRLLISSTFQPAKGVKFNYQTHLPAKVLVNGENIQISAMSQSIKEADGIFTIYGDVKLQEMPKGDEKPLQIKIAYDRLSKSLQKATAIEEPWVFDISVSTQEIARKTKTIMKNETITLNNGRTVKIDKIIISPVSTLLYYDVSDATETISFTLVTAEGERIWESGGSADSDGVSYIRYNGALDADQDYYLIPTEDRVEVGPKIPLR